MIRFDRFLKELILALVIYDVISYNLRTIGTKWDCKVSSSDIELNDNRCKIWFEVPWGPPMSALEVIIEKHTESNGKFVYAEVGGAFCGQIVFSHGEIEQNIESELQLCDTEEDDIDMDDLNNFEFNPDIELQHLRSLGG